MHCIQVILLVVNSIRHQLISVTYRLILKMFEGLENSEMYNIQT